MEKKARVVTLPFGFYTEAVEEAFRSLDDVEIVRGDLSETALAQGVKNSPVMMCHPYKFILGYVMSALDKGANRIVTFSSENTRCRLGHMWKIQEQTLRSLGYEDFEFVVLDWKKLFTQLKGLSPKASWYKVIRAFYRGWKKIREIEKAEEFSHHSINQDDLNILVVGEYYTIFTNQLNFDVMAELRKYGTKPKYGASLSQMLLDPINFFRKDKYMEEASAYLNGPVGGYGLESLASAIYACEKGYDGIVRIMPMSCFPEITVDFAITSVCKKRGMPLLTIECDENSSKLNQETRLETFVELIRRKKRNKAKEDG